MFAENLKNLRKSKGLTQVQFAQIFQISSGTIAMWETGKRTPDTETLKRIAQYFNVSIDYLLDNQKGLPENSVSPGNDEKISNNVTSPKDMDIRRIERARKNMTQKEWDKMMKILEVSFEEYFTDKYVDTTDYSDEDED